MDGARLSVPAITVVVAEFRSNGSQGTPTGAESSSTAIFP